LRALHSAFEGGELGVRVSGLGFRVEMPTLRHPLSTYYEGLGFRV
jgi:hypothetical protein